MNDVMARVLLGCVVFVASAGGAVVAMRWPSGRWPELRKARRRWNLTPDERAALDRYSANPRGDEGQAAWNAMPLWLRVAVCGECGWLDAVWEANPELGCELDRRINGAAA